MSMKLIPIILTVGGFCIGIFALYLGYRYLIRKSAPRNIIERTLAILKPDAVLMHNTGKIIDKIEQAGFMVIDLRKVQLDREQTEKFYAAHRDKKFFHQLVDFMISGPIVVLILEKINGINDWRDLMGATDPTKAKEGTIRKQFGSDITKNAVHGSDSTHAALTEIRFFFADRMR